MNSSANFDLGDLDKGSESDDSIKFFGKPIEYPEEMLNSPDVRIQTKVNEWIHDVPEPYKYPRNLYWGELQEIEGCLFQFFIDKTWKPKSVVGEANAVAI